MKLEEALRMDAGRELDALVADRVMGWSRIAWAEYAQEPETKYMGDIWATRVGNEWMHAYDINHGPDGTRGWTPSETIEEAWQVVEKVRERVSMEVEFELFANEDQTWEAAFGMRDTCSGDTAPLAICRAALAATWTDK